MAIMYNTIAGLLCDNFGKPKCGKVCALCSRRTRYWCVGCHRYFCNDVQKDQNMYRDEIKDHMKGKEDIVQITLGYTKKWRKVETEDGTTKRRPVKETSTASFKFSCHVRAHLHLLEDASSPVARKIEL